MYFDATHPDQLDNRQSHREQTDKAYSQEFDAAIQQLKLEGNYTPSKREVQYKIAEMRYGLEWNFLSEKSKAILANEAAKPLMKGIMV